VPEALQLKPAIGIAVMWTGDPADAPAAIAPLRTPVGAPAPSVDMFGEQPYCGVQQWFDDSVPHGRRYHVRSEWLGDLDGDAVDALVEDVTLEHGAVDYLVNNAGRSIRRSLELSHDRFHDFERTMAVNYFGPVRLTMGLLPAMRAQRFGHVVNIVTWGIQVKAPKFAAYIASKTALDTFSRIAGREAFFDNVTFTNLRLSLVHTPMTAPTEVYADRRGLTPEQAARKVVRALEDRPITMNVAVGTVSELLNLVAPRLSDFTMATLDRLLPDSAAAKGAPTVTSVTDKS